MDITNVPMPPNLPSGIFVYGTLKPSRSDLFARLTGTKPTTTTNQVLRGFKLFDLKAYPAIVPSTNEFDLVKGEFISFDGWTNEQITNALRNLDRYEGVPSLYVRTEKYLGTNSDGALAYVYVFTDTDKYYTSVVPKEVTIRGQAFNEYSWR